MNLKHWQPPLPQNPDARSGPGWGQYPYQMLFLRGKELTAPESDEGKATLESYLSSLRLPEKP